MNNTHPLCNAQHYDLCKLQECIFNKENGTVTMMGARFLQRFTIGYNKKSNNKKITCLMAHIFPIVVSQLDEVIAVTTESTKPNFLGTAHQVKYSHYCS